MPALCGAGVLAQLGDLSAGQVSREIGGGETLALHAPDQFVGPGHVALVYETSGLGKVPLDLFV